MYLRNWHIALTIALAAPLAACSSSDEELEQDRALRENPEARRITAMRRRPCGNLNTGYPGDENCILPPPEGKGFQFHYGPKDYTEAEMSKWLIGPGQEVTDCILIDTPNTEDILLQRVSRAHAAGLAPHAAVHRSGRLARFGPTADCGCSEGFTQRNIFGAQTEVLDVKRESDAPENFGLATRLPARQQGIMQLHFFNTHPTDNMLKESWANLIYVEDPCNRDSAGGSDLLHLRRRR